MVARGNPREPRGQQCDGLVAVVDDDHSVLRSLKNLLASVGLRVETFASAEAFLESGCQRETRCLVLDLAMPGMNGGDLLAHLTRSRGAIPVIMLTAHGPDAERERLLGQGAFAFMTKPVRAGEMVAAVRSALRRGRNG